MKLNNCYLSPLRISIYMWIAGVLLLSLSCGAGDNIPQPVDNLLEHPQYRDYVYRQPGTITIGTQPLYMPTGLITETMKRDRVLQRQLAQLSVKLKFYAYLKGNDVNFFIKRGDLDMGIGGDMPALSLAAESEIAIPALVQYGHTSLVTSENILAADLRGKSIAYALGSNAHFMLLNVLSRAYPKSKYT